NAKGVAEDWLTQLSSSQVDSAYEMTATAYQEGTNKEQFDVFLEAYPIMSAVQEVSFESVERQSTNGQSLTTLTGTITGTDGTTSPIEMMLISEGEDWKVYNVDLRGL
ncbi:MAG: hypothetical protein Q8P33_01720, partial [bacterium]|nr:hypothetical protein [bacterium]